jgi:hypothetical protein
MCALCADDLAALDALADKITALLLLLLWPLATLALYRLMEYGALSPHTGAGTGC